MSIRDPHTYGLTLNGRLNAGISSVSSRLAAVERRGSGGTTIVTGTTTTVGDATSVVKGKVQLAGHLAGTAAAPLLATTTEAQVTRLTSGVAPTATTFSSVVQPYALAVKTSATLKGSYVADYSNWYDFGGLVTSVRNTATNINPANMALTNRQSCFYSRLDVRGAGQVNAGGWLANFIQCVDTAGVQAKAITSIDAAGVALTASHTYVVGERVIVHNTTNSAHNDEWIVQAIPDTTHVTLGPAFPGGTSTGGRITNAPFLFGISVGIQASVDRSVLGSAAGQSGGVNGDDVGGYALHNSGTGRATDGFYLARSTSVTGTAAAGASPPTNSSWISGFTCDTDVDFGFRVGAVTIGGASALAAYNEPYGAAYDCSNATFVAGAHAFRFPNAGANHTGGIAGKIATGLAYKSVLNFGTSDQVLLADDASNISVWSGGTNIGPSNTNGRVLGLLGSLANVPEIKIHAATTGAAASQGQLNIYAYNTNGTSLERLLVANQGFWGVIGTVTSIPLSLWAFNTEVMRLIPGGEVAIGTRMSAGGGATGTQAGEIMDNSGRIDITRYGAASPVTGQVLRVYTNVAGAGDANPRFAIGFHANNSAQLEWGSGGAATDVWMSRAGAKELLLDGAIHLNYTVDHGYIEFRNQTGTVAAPSTATRVRLYAKLVGSDARLFYQNTTEGEVALGTGTGTTDHGALTGLGDDDHTIYPLLAGRATGQTLYGGTAASENLTLHSTSHATKGSIFFGASSAYDGVNFRLGLNTTTPAATLTLATGTTMAAGIQLGTAAGSAVNMFRSANDELRVGDDSNINSIALNCGGLGTSATNNAAGFANCATVGAASTLYVGMSKQGFFDIGRSSGSEVFRMFSTPSGSALSTVTSPVFAIGFNGVCRWGPGGTTAVDHNLSRVDAGFMKFNVSLEVGNQFRVGTSTASGYGFLANTNAQSLGLAASEGAIRLRNDKLYFAFNDAGTVRYVTLATGVGASTTEPS